MLNALIAITGYLIVISAVLAFVAAASRHDVLDLPVYPDGAVDRCMICSELVKLDQTHTVTRCPDCHRFVHGDCWDLGGGCPGH